MKKCLLVVQFILLVVVGSCVAGMGGAKAQSLGGYSIEDYDVEINVGEDSSFEVKETIDVNFSEYRHGIYRYIPVKYKDDFGLEYNHRLKLISVTDESGNPRNIADKGKEGRNYMIKIGDPDETVVGKQVYVINYQIKNGFQFFDDHSELFWNPIGTGWDVPIEDADVKITFPENIDLRNFEENFVCYTGEFGSKEQDCSGEYDYPNQISITADKTLGAGEGLTVAVRLRPGDIQKPSIFQKIWWFVGDNFGFALPVVVLIVMYFVWREWGREIDLKKTVIAQYEPPDNLSPGELGYLWKERYNSNFLAADIVDLAVKGYLDIIEKKKTFKNQYEIVKKNDWSHDNNLTGQQKEILSTLFSGGRERVDLSKRSSDLQKLLRNSATKTKDQIKNKGYFFNRWWNNNNVYVGIAVVVGFLIFFAGISAQRLDVIFGAVAGEIIAIAFSFFMSKKTRKGAEAYWYAEGFKEYINTAERYRVKFQEEENIFERFLPYAMVFGLAGKWSKAFEGIQKENPNWYHGASSTNAFSAAAISSFASDFSSNTASSLAPSSSSSSGFSGGGGGGGGGGSW